MRILLIDLTQYGPTPTLARMLQQQGKVHVVAGTEGVDKGIRAHAPDLLCFELDYPDVPRLRALQRAKQRHSALPVLMVTEYHSEALAVWAFRTQVWDYFVKPLSPEQFLASLTALRRLLRQAAPSRRAMLAPERAIPVDARFHSRSGAERVLRAAMAHVLAHLHNRVSQRDVAAQCAMSPSSFSRTFKQVYGATFQDSLMRARIEAASKLLRNPSASITDVCWAVGFHDLSYFTRVFRRHVGATPSRFRAAVRRQSVAAQAAGAAEPQRRGDGDLASHATTSDPAARTAPEAQAHSAVKPEATDSVHRGLKPRTGQGAGAASGASG